MNEAEANAEGNAEDEDEDEVENETIDESKKFKITMLGINNDNKKRKMKGLMSRLCCYKNSKFFQFEIKERKSLEKLNTVKI